jgi:cytochrome P450
LDDLTQFNPFDPEQRGHHLEVTAELRERCPVAHLTCGLVAVSRFDDVREALNHRSLRNADAGRAPGVSVPPEDRLFFFEYDPPEHGQLRRLLLDQFSRGRAEREVPAIRSLVEELLGKLLADGGGDIVAGLSVPLSGRMMMRIAGFPTEDAPQWRAWISDMVLSGFSFTNRNQRGVGHAECYPELLAYLDDHIAARAAADDQPDDVLTRVLHAELDGEPLTRTQQRMILASVVSAGTNTLVNFTSNTMSTLARNPKLVDSLRADRSLVPLAVEESLRLDSPSMYITRVCVGATNVEDTVITPGERVLLHLASANRDDRAFPEPEAFRLDRHDQPQHVAFGWGSHLCLGAPIARQVGVTTLDTFLDLVETISLEPGREPRPYLSVQGNGLDQLPVRLVARSG